VISRRSVAHREYRQLKATLAAKLRAAETGTRETIQNVLQEGQIGANHFGQSCR